MTHLAKTLVAAGYFVDVIKAADEYYGLDIEEDAEQPVDSITQVVVRSKNKYLQYYEWIGAYIKAADKLIRNKKYSVCLISASPYQYFAAANRLAKKHGIPLVLDIRDRLAPDACGVEHYTGVVALLNRIRLKINLEIERSAIKAASACVLVGRDEKNWYKNKYINSGDKFYVVRNGYDASVMTEIEKLSTPLATLLSNKSLRLAVLGKMGFYVPEHLVVLRDALDELVDAGFSVQFDQYYPDDTNCMNCFKDRDYYCVREMLPYKSALATLRSNYDVMVTSNLPYGIGTKIFDYILVNKPVIAICTKGSELAEIASSFENGFVCETSEEVILALTSICERSIQVLDSSENKRLAFSREEQEKEYIKIIQAVEQ